MPKKFICMLVGLCAILTACTSTPTADGAFPTEGIWQATFAYDTGQSLPTNTQTAGLYKLMVSGGNISGSFHLCSAWATCKSTGYLVNGTVSSDGAAMVTYTYKFSDSTSFKFDITGTFSSKGFGGRFVLATTGQANKVGTFNMAWLQGLSE